MTTTASPIAAAATPAETSAETSTAPREAVAKSPASARVHVPRAPDSTSPSSRATKPTKPAKPSKAPPTSKAPKSTSTASDVAAPAIWLDPKTLLPWAKNPKRLEPKDVREMKRSIRRFGFGAPIVVRAFDHEIIEGHLRHAASLALRLDKVPVRLLDISADEAHLLAIAAWKFEHRRDADEDEVAGILDELEERGIDIELGTGFDDKEIDKLLAKGDGSGDPALGGEGATSSVRGHKRRHRASSLVFRIIIDCTDEAHQTELLERLGAEGLACKTIVV